MRKRFYVDTCIYLNLWQREGNNKKGKPYWKIAQEFFEQYDNKNTLFYYSGFLLKEMKFIINNENLKKRRNYLKLQKIS